MSPRRERAAAATERRASGSRKGVTNSKQEVRSVRLTAQGPKKVLKRGREVEKIMTTSGCGVGFLPFNVANGPLTPRGFLFIGPPTQITHHTRAQSQKVLARSVLASASGWCVPR